MAKNFPKKIPKDAKHGPGFKNTASSDGRARPCGCDQKSTKKSNP